MSSVPAWDWSDMGISIVPTLKVLKPVGLIIGGGFAGLLLGYWVNITYFADDAPQQPIDFSHRIHATDFEIPCMYCHVQARRSASAGVPSVSKCAGCHQEVATDRAQIKKLMAFWENKEPIPWIKVHDLPDFVHFPHNRHVAAGLECQTCHGPVETMDRVKQIAPLKMGWCLNCHKEYEVENGLDCWTCHK